MWPFAECTGQRGETESMNVWARGVFCLGESADRCHVHLYTMGHSGCHVGGQDLHCQEWCVVPPHIKSVGRRRKRPLRGRAKRSTTCGRLLLYPPFNFLTVTAGQLEESLRGPSRRNRSQASKKRRSSGGRRKTTLPTSRLRQRLAAVANERQSVRKELGCGQRDTSSTVAARTMHQVMFLEGRKSKRSRQHNKTSGAAMEVSKQHSGELLKSFLRTKGVLAEAMVSLTAVGRPTDVRDCFENEEPLVGRLRLPPRRGWLRHLPAKGPLPKHGVYIGRSCGAFYQPQGWGNPFKPNLRKVVEYTFIQKRFHPNTISSNDTFI